MALVVKNLPANSGDARDTGLILGWKDPWSRKRQPTPVFLPGKVHGQRNLAGCSPWGHKESDTTEATERTHTGVNRVDLFVAKGNFLCDFSPLFIFFFSGEKVKIPTHLSSWENYSLHFRNRHLSNLFFLEARGFSICVPTQGPR